MKRQWHRLVGAVLLGAALTGCLARPAPRPTPSNTGTVTDQVDVGESQAVTATVNALGDTGVSRAVVLGDVALVALRLNAISPVGLVSQGPAYVKGPGGSTGYTPAVPGGAYSPGGWTPGGTPNSTQAVPNISGDLQTQNPTSTSPTAVPGVRGNATMDVMHRTSDQVRARHPRVKEVRFLSGNNDAVRLAVISQDLAAGQAPVGYVAELRALHARSIPAGTTMLPPNYPPQGGYSIQSRSNR